jgi:hypothetical protein
MLHLVSGNLNDRKDYINTLISDAGGDPSLVQRVSLQDIEDTDISSVVVTQPGLFGDQEYFVLSGMARELPLKSLLQEYADSPNLIIFSEETVTKKITEAFQKVGADYKECAPELKEKAVPPNIFQLADLLGRRDKKNLWIAYHEALRNSSVEEINGVLLWQLKNMVLVKTSEGSVPGMKPFVYKKNQGFVKNYSLEELKDVIKRCTFSFHNRDIYDTLDIQIEKIILSL